MLHQWYDIRVCCLYSSLLTMVQMTAMRLQVGVNGLEKGVYVLYPIDEQLS